MKRLAVGFVGLLVLATCSVGLRPESPPISSAPVTVSPSPSVSPSRPLPRPAGVDPAICTSYVLAKISDNQAYVQGDTDIIGLTISKDFRQAVIQIAPLYMLTFFGAKPGRSVTNDEGTHIRHITISSPLPFAVIAICAIRQDANPEPSPTPTPSTLSV